MLTIAASNQDVFRWPAIKAGTEKMLLGLFITTLYMPGIPLLNWGGRFQVTMRLVSLTNTK